MGWDELEKGKPEGYKVCRILVVGKVNGCHGRKGRFKWQLCDSGRPTLKPRLSADPDREATSGNLTGSTQQV